MNLRLRLALYQPDMPSNTGAIMRFCACMGVGLDIIEPCGFVFDDRKLRRAAMDYIEHLSYARHRSWADFAGQLGGRRMVLLTTKGDLPYYRFSFRPDDVLMVGRESAGVPFDVHQSVHARIVIPMQKGARSLNVGMAAAIVASEALRQCEAYNEPAGSREYQHA
ncbi:MAG: tRNA (cytidine(34)-2'-O)-methyltransferase [Bdellovibrionales bacterium]